MEKQILESLSKVGMSSYESVKSLYEINSNIVEQMFEQQLALISLSTECTARQLKLASEAKGYKEIISGQTEIAADIGSKVQGIARNTVDIINESKDEMSDWFEKNVKEAEKSMKEATKVVPLAKTKAA